MRTAIVTGAGRGIGRAIAERFLDDGWGVLLVDRDERVAQTAAELAARGGPPAGAVEADLATEAGRAAVLAAADDAAGGAPLGALVNNAGITRDAMLHKMTEEQFRTVLRVNLGAAYELTTALAPRLADGGAIVHLSSKSASGNVGQYNYAISKAGLLGLTRSLALALAPRLRVNAVAPAFIATEMTDAIPDDLRAGFIAKIPLARAGEAREVADVVVGLCGERSSYVTGQCVAVCGGRSFGP